LLICTPSPFICDHGVFTTKPPWSVTKIYPLIGFEPFLEVDLRSTEINYPDSSMISALKMLSQELSHGICSLSAFGCRSASQRISDASDIKNISRV
jgi:hypothetical protein